VATLVFIACNAVYKPVITRPLMEVTYSLVCCSHHSTTVLFTLFNIISHLRITDQTNSITTVITLTITKITTYLKPYIYRLISFTKFNAQFLYSLTICMLHYNPRRVSSINMPIFRGTICIITAFGIITLCKRLYSRPDESRLQSSLLSSGILYSRLQRVTIPDVVIIQFELLKMGMLMLETCRGL
jgi:hypothetical protein